MFVIVAGAGLIGSAVIRMLVKNRHDVVVVDVARDVCETIHAETGAVAIHGSATNIGVLEEAGARKADVLLCLMRNDADNIACALLSKSLKVPRIVARLRNPLYEEAYRLSGITSVVRVADLLLNQIVTEIERPKVRKIMTLGGGKAQVYAVKMPERAKSVGMTIKQITEKRNFPSECVFMGIYRETDGDFMIPRGNHVIREGDMVFLVSKSQYIKKATDFLTKTR
jgi:trk system potassium uptake protein TrkA